MVCWFPLSIVDLVFSIYTYVSFCAMGYGKNTWYMREIFQTIWFLSLIDKVTIKKIF